MYKYINCSKKDGGRLNKKNEENKNTWNKNKKKLKTIKMGVFSLFCLDVCCTVCD